MNYPKKSYSVVHFAQIGNFYLQPYSCSCIKYNTAPNFSTSDTEAKEKINYGSLTWKTTLEGTLQITSESGLRILWLSSATHQHGIPKHITSHWCFEMVEVTEILKVWKATKSGKQIRPFLKQTEPGKDTQHLLHRWQST